MTNALDPTPSSTFSAPPPSPRKSRLRRGAVLALRLQRAARATAALTDRARPVAP